MESFEDLGLAPEFAEVLSAEGIESPTPLQRDAIPVLLKGNHLIMEAGPGSGLHLSWCLPLLQRLDPAEAGPSVLVVCASDSVAEELAEATARVASVTDHRVAAIGSAWALQEKAHFVFGTPGRILRTIAAGLSTEHVQALVVDQAQLVELAGALPDVERILDYLPEACQRVASALPISAGISDWFARSFKRTVTVPAPPTTDPPKRGEVRFRIAPEPREAATLSVVEELLRSGADHVLVFCGSEDRLADVGDLLTLHGFVAGAPGDTEVPVWLGSDPLAARAASDGVAGVMVVSSDVPADQDTLDRRHAISSSSVVILLPREVAHLKKLGRRTGYDTVPFPPAAADRDPMRDLRESIESAIESEDTAAYMVALEPLLARHDPMEVAAAAVALLRKGTVPASQAPSRTAHTPSAAVGETPSWSKLFVTVGERDGLLKGDLLGAITGEASVAGDQVGRIDIKESHSLVEVHTTVAQQVIGAINGTTIKGRAVRVDFDRPRKAPAGTRKIRRRP